MDTLTLDTIGTGSVVISKRNKNYKTLMGLVADGFLSAEHLGDGNVKFSRVMSVKKIKQMVTVTLLNILHGLDEKNYYSMFEGKVVTKLVMPQGNNLHFASIAVNGTLYKTAKFSLEGLFGCGEDVDTVFENLAMKILN